MNLLAAMSQSIHRWRRARRFRSAYQSLLNESASSLEDRVRFHLKQLQEYWGRCIGFLVMGVSPDGIVRSDVLTCVLVATKAATDDVRDYCTRHGDESLREDWANYRCRMAVIQSGAPDLRQNMEACAQAVPSARA